MNQAKELLAKLDEAGPAQCREVEAAIVALGDAAVDDMLESIHLLNSKLNGSISVERLNPLAEMVALEKRIRILGQMKRLNTLKAIFDALADAAIAVNDYKRQGEQTSTMIRMFAYEHQAVAESLLKTATDALVEFGAVVIPPARRYLQQGPPPVTKALRRVLAKVDKQWWQIWR